MKIAAVAFVLLGACACGQKKETGSGTGTGTGTAAGCEEARPNVERIYGGNADDVAMVMKDCAQDPARVAPCAAAAKDATELEARCLLPLDEEGSEGDRFKVGSPP